MIWLELLIKFAPVILTFLLLKEKYLDSFIVFVSLELIEICVRAVYNGEGRMTVYQLGSEFSLKTNSPRILIPLLNPKFDIFALLLLEGSTFLALRRGYSRFFNVWCTIVIAAMFYNGFFDILSLGVVVVSFALPSLHLLFHHYEIYSLQAIMCLIVLDIQRNTQTIERETPDPYHPRTILLLAEIAIVSLYFMIAFATIADSLLDGSTPIRKMFIFMTILLLQITLFIWPLYIIIIGHNPLKWFVNLFAINRFLGIYYSLFWVLTIVFTVWFASFVSERYDVSKIIRRKIFHVLVIVMFLPAVIMTGSAHGFVIYAMAGALAVFVLIEFFRNYSLREELNFIQSYFDHFLLDKGKKHESNHNIITSHISLLLAVGSSVWFYALLLEEPLEQEYSIPRKYLELIPYLGLITVGVGDSMAAVIGSLYGKRKWPSSNKTMLGSLAAFVSMLLSAVFVEMVILRDNQNELKKNEWIILICTFGFTTLAEVFIDANDNLFLPIYCIVMYIGFNFLLR
jgi:dolichol kinase